MSKDYDKIFNNVSKFCDNITTVEQALDSINNIVAAKIHLIETIGTEGLTSKDINMLYTMSKILCDIRKLRNDELNKQLLEVKWMTADQRNQLYKLTVEQYNRVITENKQLKQTVGVLPNGTN